MKIVIIPDDEDYEDAVAVGLMVNTALSDAPDVEAQVSTMQPDAVLVACFPTFRPRQMDDRSGQAGTPRPRSSGVCRLPGVVARSHAHGTGGEPLDGQHQPFFGGSARPMPRETWEIGGATEA